MSATLSSRAEPTPGEPGEDDLLHPVYAVTNRLRWLLLAHALLVNVLRVHEVSHPGFMVLACLVMLVWTVLVTRWQANTRTRTVAVSLSDLAVTWVLVASSRWVLGRPALVQSFLAVPGYWMVACPLVIAVRRGWRWGLGTAALLSLTKFVQEPRIDDRVWQSFAVTVIAVWATGAIVDTLRESLAERQQNQARAAALAERDRLNRIVHDGALQVLAMVEREGSELGPRGETLAAMARSQERVLRRQLQDRDVELPSSAAQQRAQEHAQEQCVDLAHMLEEHAGPRVTVSVVDQPRLGQARARELDAAVSEALLNVVKHAGEQARAWVLLEEDGDQVVVTVRDNGVGMSREHVEQAADSGRLGIHASILGRLADLGGVAVARSQPGRGVEWELRVPMGQE